MQFTEWLLYLPSEILRIFIKLWKILCWTCDIRKCSESYDDSDSKFLVPEAVWVLKLVMYLERNFRSMEPTPLRWEDLRTGLKCFLLWYTEHVKQYFPPSFAKMEFQEGTQLSQKYTEISLKLFMQVRWLLPTGRTCSDLERSSFSRVHSKLDLDWMEQGRNIRKDLQLMRVNTPIKQNLHKTAVITAPACSRPRKYRLGLVGLSWGCSLHPCYGHSGNPRDKRL